MSGPVLEKRSFSIISDNTEINTINIMLKLLNNHTDAERKRVLDYVVAWCNDPINSRSSMTGYTPIT